MAKGLTVISVEKAKADKARREIPDALLPGLYLVVQPSGKKSWAVRYRRHGKPCKLTLGPFPTLELGPAREKARAALTAVQGGKDPAQEKREAAQSSDDGLFETVLKRFIDEYGKANTREKTWKEYERVLKREFLPKWKGRPVQSITSREAGEIIQAIAARGAGVMANRAHAHLHLFFSWCADPKRAILETAPMLGRRPKKYEPPRTRTLTNAELKAIWKAADAMSYPAREFWKLLLLTGQRREDVAGAAWPEFDIDGKIWTIRPHRYKQEAPQAVPLCRGALAVIAKAERFTEGSYMLTTTGGKKAIAGFSKLKVAMDKAIGTDPENGWTIHDIRRTVRTRLASLKVEPAIAELVLGHAKRGMVRVYDQHEHRPTMRAALTKWEAALDRIVNGAKPKARPKFLKAA